MCLIPVFLGPPEPWSRIVLPGHESGAVLVLFSPGIEQASVSRRCGDVLIIAMLRLKAEPRILLGWLWVECR